MWERKREGPELGKGKDGGAAHADVRSTRGAGRCEEENGRVVHDLDADWNVAGSSWRRVSGAGHREWGGMHLKECIQALGYARL